MTGRKPPEETLSEAVPTIKTHWYSSNSTTPDQVSSKSTTACYYYCPRCEQVTLRKAKDIAHRPKSCSVCSGKLVIPGINDALTAQPLLDRLWDYSKNETSPSEYSRQSGKKAWLKCQACQKSTLRKICDAVRSPNSCLVCSGRGIIPGHNDLASQHPKLMEEWAARNTKDPKLLPASGGRHFAWFTCTTCSNEWRTSIAWRVKGNGCPYCANQKVKEGFNDLATTRPALLSYWDYSRNTILPTQLTGGSNILVHWKCPKGHTWLGTPSSRWNSTEQHPHECNSCSRATRTSLGEKEVYHYIRTRYPDAVQADSTLYPSVEVDVYIPSLSIAIEYNGDYWHSTQLMQEKYGIDAKTFHKNRQEKLATVGITLYYIWENDWKENSETIKQLLETLPHVTHHPLLMKLENES